MTDKPIIFSAPMVRALLDGNKTQTRRVLNPQPVGHPEIYQPMSDEDAFWATFDDREVATRLRVRYAPGDRLYVREAMHWTDNLRFVADDAVVDFDRMPEGFTAGRAHVSGMFMPRWASRITLTVTEVLVQRLQEISEADARAEGLEEVVLPDWPLPVFPVPGVPFYGAGDCMPTARDAFACLWMNLHGPDAWDANPWVVAVSFTVDRRNIDA